MSIADKLGDFAAELGAQPVLEGSRYGIAWGYKDAENYKAFTVVGNEYIVTEVKNGETNLLFPPTEDSRILEEKVKKLGLLVQGDTVSQYIDGALLKTFNAKSNTGKVGLVLDNGKVTFFDLRVVFPKTP